MGDILEHAFPGDDTRLDQRVDAGKCLLLRSVQVEGVHHFILDLSVGEEIREQDASDLDDGLAIAAQDHV